MAVFGGVVAMLVWELIVAIVAKRRPVPLILYAVGAVVAAIVAAVILTSRTAITSTLLVGSVATGFFAAVGVVLIWAFTSDEEARPGSGVAVRVVRDLVIRGAAFSVLIFVISLVVRAVHHGSPSS